MKKHNFFRLSLSGALALVSMFTLSLVVQAAQKVAAGKPATAVAPKGKDKAKVIAKIGNLSITVQDLENRINKQIPFIRKRYTDKKNMEQFIENVVDSEVLAMEAKSKGFDKNPQVLKALRKVMIHRQRQKILEERVKLSSITTDEVKAYYDKHLVEFKRPERRRAAIIVVKTKPEAEKLLKDVQEAKGNLRKFQKLVKKNSIDGDTKKRGGLLPFFDKTSKTVEKPIVDATYAMKKAGEISPIVPVKAGFAIIRLSGISPQVDKSMEQVTMLIKKRLLKDKQQKAFKAYIDELKAKAKITVDEAKLDLVKIDVSRGRMGSGFHRPGQRMPRMPRRGIMRGPASLRGRTPQQPHRPLQKPTKGNGQKR